MPDNLSLIAPDRAPMAALLDLLRWLEAGPRSYAEVMDVWRTSCPRLTVWEDAWDLRMVRRTRAPGGSVEVALTASGRTWLEEHASAGREP